MFNRKKKYSNASLGADFGDLAKFSKKVVLTGDVIAILQNMLTVIATNDGLRAIADNTLSASVHKTVKMINDANDELINYMGLEIPEDVEYISTKDLL